MTRQNSRGNGAARRQRGASSMETALMLALIALVAIGAIRALGGAVGGEDVDTANEALGDEVVTVDESTTNGASAANGAGGSSGAIGSAASGVRNTGQQAGSSNFDHGADTNFWNTRWPGEQIGDWTVTSGSVDARVDEKGPFDIEVDGNFMDMNGHGPGRVERTVEVIAGADYNLSIDLGENSFGGPAAKTLAVEWNGVRISTLEVDLPNNVTRTFTVKLPPSDSSEATLAFQSLNYSAHGVLIDNPTLTLIPVRAETDED